MKNSLGKQVKELLPERALDDAQLERIADILQEKLNAPSDRLRQTAHVSSWLDVAR